MDPPAQDDSLARLESLQQDLEFLAQDRLPNLQRLVQELQDSIEDFQSLLQTKAKNNASRQALASGKFETGGVEYTVNDEFKQQTLQLAESLDLDELEAAALFLQAQSKADDLDRPASWCAVWLFYRKRQLLLQCLQRTLSLSLSEDLSEDATALLKSVGDFVLADGKPGSSSDFVARSFAAMTDIENRLQRIAERLQSFAMTQTYQSDSDQELVNIQRDSLLSQHGLLSVIVCVITTAGHSTHENLRFLVGKLKTFNRYDVTLVHYLPCLITLFVQFGSSEAQCSEQEATALNQLIASPKDGEPWSIRTLQAAASALWLPQYSSRYADTLPGSASHDKELEAQSEKMHQQFMDNLRDGAFQFILGTCQAFKQDVPYDPVRQGFVAFLMNDTSPLHLDTWKFSEDFKKAFAHALQFFIEAFITNMPDTLRLLKFEEDEQRRQLQSRLQLRPGEYELHLERFLMIIAHAYEDDTDASSAFWTDVDSNLYGFLQWASQRQSTPRVAAFCEMLRALSNGEENADAAHAFLLDESHSSSGRHRRNSPLSWHHVYNELKFYTSNIRDRISIRPLSDSTSRNQAEPAAEPESSMMLESYLRLIEHFSRQSPKARRMFLDLSNMDMQEHLLMLCGSDIESRLRGCAFVTMTALLEDKSTEAQYKAWTTLDSWISGGAAAMSANQRPPPQLQQIPPERFILEMISTGFEEPNSFVQYLNELISPSSDEPSMTTNLPFPNNLGQAYRMPGIDLFVDFVMGRILAYKTTELSDELQVQILRLNCLRFARMCLTSFNEDLVTFLKRRGPPGDQAQKDSHIGTYLRLHPFARTMEWLFNETVVSVLFATAIQDVDKINNADTNSPLIQSLTCSIEVIKLVLDLQSTFFTVVRPAIKLSGTSRTSVASHSSLTSFEDAILKYLKLVPCLGFYAASGHDALALPSLNLLQKLSLSSKLSKTFAESQIRRSSKNRLLSALEESHNDDRIARSMYPLLILDAPMLISGEESPDYRIKEHLLAFFKESLRAAKDGAGIAHLLLGFKYDSNGLAPNDLFEIGRSLFHLVVALVLTCPDVIGDSYQRWLLRLRDDAFQIIRTLWRSMSTRLIVIPELRAYDFIYNLEPRREPISADVLWNGLTFGDVGFFDGETGASMAVVHALRIRTAYLECMAVECQNAHAHGLTTLTSQLRDLLLAPPLASGLRKAGVLLLDLLDFLELPGTDPLPLPQTRYFEANNYEDFCVQDETGARRYDLAAVNQLLTLQTNELLFAQNMKGTPEEDLIRADVGNLMQCLDSNSNRARLQATLTEALRSWVHLVIIVLECCKYDDGQKYTTVMQIIQAILPRFEYALNNDNETAMILSQLMLNLLTSTDFAQSSNEDSKNTDMGEDRFFQLMRIAMVGIQAADCPTVLRERCCQIVHRYVQGITQCTGRVAARHFTFQSFRSLGQPLVEVLCDDAYAGEGSMRVTAMLLLGSIVNVADLAGAKYLVDAFSKLNFIQVVVSNLKSLPGEVQQANEEDLPGVLAYHDLSLSLLLCVAHTRVGANAVLNANFFGSVGESGLFDADPDVGLGVDNPAALTKYFDLLLSVSRVISAILISLGEHKQAIIQVREFLTRYRQTIVSVFKRDAGIGSVAQNNVEVVTSLADKLMFLITASGFLEAEEEASGGDSSGPVLFS